MDLICPQCLGTLEPQDGQSARCPVHGGEFQILFSRLPPPLKPPLVAPEPEAVPEPAAAPAQPPVLQGMVCARHVNEPAVCLCADCCEPLCAACAVLVRGGVEMCSVCADRKPELHLEPAPPDTGNAPPTLSQVPEGVCCVQHPHLRAMRQCRTCGAFMCPTCDFDLPDGIHLCPACASTPKTTLSPRRKKLMYGSFALAVWCTIGLAVVMTGVLSDSIRTKADENALDAALTVLLLIPSAIGTAMGWSALGRRLSNPPALWVATVWNGLILAGWLLLCIVGSFR